MSLRYAGDDVNEGLNVAVPDVVVVAVVFVVVNDASSLGVVYNCYCVAVTVTVADVGADADAGVGGDCSKVIA